MDGQTVLAAVTSIRKGLESAIDFSCSYFNEAGVCHTHEVDAFDFYERHRVAHCEWQAAIWRARRDLESADYPFPREWWSIDVSTPQVAFSRYPVERYSDGTETGKLWILGAAESTLGATRPKGAENTLAPGDVWDEPADEISEVFDSRQVNSWREILPEILAIERRLADAMIVVGGRSEANGDGAGQESETIRQSGGRKGGTVNERMAAELVRNPGCIGWTRKDWAQKLNCKESAVQSTDTWSTIRRMRDAEKLRRSDQPK